DRDLQHGLDPGLGIAFLRHQPGALKFCIGERPGEIVALGERIELIAYRATCLPIIEHEMRQAAHVKTVRDGEQMTEGAAILRAGPGRLLRLLRQPESPKAERIEAHRANPRIVSAEEERVIAVALAVVEAND